MDTMDMATGTAITAEQLFWWEVSDRKKKKTKEKKSLTRFRLQAALGSGCHVDRRYDSCYDPCEPCEPCDPCGPRTTYVISTPPPQAYVVAPPPRPPPAYPVAQAVVMPPVAVQQPPQRPRWQPGEQFTTHLSLLSLSLLSLL